MTDDWIKMWSVYAREYYLAVKRGIVLSVKTWMDLGGGVMLSEISWMGRGDCGCREGKKTVTYLSTSFLANPKSVSLM